MFVMFSHRYCVNKLTQYLLLVSVVLLPFADIDCFRSETTYQSQEECLSMSITLVFKLLTPFFWSKKALLFTFKITGVLQLCY